ncbi:hypothetical protein V6Z11_D05G355300 [Gossypium hirsutum]
MASLNVYFVLVVLFLACVAVMSMKENDQIIKENNCETKIGLPCVLEAFMSIFETGSISNKCCGEIVHGCGKTWKKKIEHTHLRYAFIPISDMSLY